MNSRFILIPVMAACLFTSAISHAGSEDIDLLIQALNEGNSSVRLESVRALEETKDDRAVEPLIHALKDNNSSIRATAASALGETKDTRAVEPLIQALNDDDAIVAMMAAQSLREFGDSRAIEPLIEAFKSNVTSIKCQIGRTLSFCSQIWRQFYPKNDCLCIRRV
jgi:HEAT repeat protein